MIAYTESAPSVRGMLAVLPGSEGASVTGTACPSDSITDEMSKTQVNLKLNAPAADLPVKRVVGAVHFILDLTLPDDRVLHDDKNR